MPCRDYDDDVRYIAQDRPETVAMLCEACRTLDGMEMLKHLSKDINQWWKAHKREDAARLEAEKLRLNRENKIKHIMSKLSKEFDLLRTCKVQLL